MLRPPLRETLAMPAAAGRAAAGTTARTMARQRDAVRARKKTPPSVGGPGPASRAFRNAWCRVVRPSATGRRRGDRGVVTEVVFPTGHPFGSDPALWEETPAATSRLPVARLRHARLARHGPQWHRTCEPRTGAASTRRAVHRGRSPTMVRVTHATGRNWILVLSCLAGLGAASAALAAPGGIPAGSKLVFNFNVI